MMLTRKCPICSNYMTQDKEPYERDLWFCAVCGWEEGDGLKIN